MKFVHSRRIRRRRETERRQHNLLAEIEKQRPQRHRTVGCTNCDDPNRVWPRDDNAAINIQNKGETVHILSKKLHPNLTRKVPYNEIKPSSPKS